MFLFRVSKSRAAVVCILCALTALPFSMMGDNLGMIGGAFLCWSFIYGCIWLAKSSRDKRIVRQAETVQPKLEVEQSVTSTGSNRLFVPPPVDR